jgi:ribosome biogenesis GTPase
MAAKRSRKKGGRRKRRWSPHDADAQHVARRRFLASGEGGAPDVEQLYSDAAPNAIVVSPYGLSAYCEPLGGGEERLSKIAERLTDGKRTVLAPGDRVVVEQLEDQWWVTQLAPRESSLSRPTAGGARERVIAANVDRLVIVTSLAQPPLKPGLIDRYLIVGDVGGVTPLVCVNKMDLGGELPEELAAYQELGVAVLPTSCETGLGIDELRQALHGKVSVLAGQSGVGKSSLINALDPSFDLHTQTVSGATDKGRHTTTSSRLYRLAGAIRIIDTPGLRKLGLWGVTAEDLPLYFPEIRERAAQCRFRDCAHFEEPGCAVRGAAEEEAISPLRYNSYRRIRRSLGEGGDARPRPGANVPPPV